MSKNATSSDLLCRWIKNYDQLNCTHESNGDQHMNQMVTKWILLTNQMMKELGRTGTSIKSLQDRLYQNYLIISPAPNVRAKIIFQASTHSPNTIAEMLISLSEPGLSNPLPYMARGEYISLSCTPSYSIASLENDLMWINHLLHN